MRHLLFGAEGLKAGGIGHTTLEQHEVRAAGVDHEARLPMVELHSNGYGCAGVNISKGAEKDHVLDLAEAHFSGSVVEAEAAFC